jgi:hypothetical protein
MLKIFAYYILYECRLLLSLSPLYFYETKVKDKGERMFIPKKIVRDRYSDLQVLTLLDSLFLFVNERRKEKKILLSTSEPNEYCHLNEDVFIIDDLRKTFQDEIKIDQKSPSYMSNSFPPLNYSQSNQTATDYVKSLPISIPSIERKNDSIEKENKLDVLQSSIENFDMINDFTDFDDFSEDEFDMMNANKEDKILYLFENPDEIKKFEKFISCMSILSLLEYDKHNQETLTSSYENDNTMFDLCLFLRKRITDKLNLMNPWFINLTSINGFVDIKTCEEVVFSLLSESEVLEDYGINHSFLHTSNSLGAKYDSIYRICCISVNIVRDLIDKLSILGCEDTRHFSEYVSSITKIPFLDPTNYQQFSNDLQERLLLMIYGNSPSRKTISKQILNSFIQIFKYLFIEFRRRKMLVTCFSDVIFLLDAPLFINDIKDNEIHKLIKQPLYIYLLL